MEEVSDENIATLQRLMETRTWKKQTHRTNIASSFTRTHKVSKEGKEYTESAVNEPQHSEYHPRGEILEFVRTMLPDWFEAASSSA